jgi:hypothetical protein
VLPALLVLSAADDTALQKFRSAPAHNTCMSGIFWHPDELPTVSQCIVGQHGFVLTIQTARSAKHSQQRSEQLRAAPEYALLFTILYFFAGTTPVCQATDQRRRS